MLQPPELRLRGRVLVAGVLTAAICAACGGSSEIADLVTASRSTLHLDGERLTGDGAAALREAIAGAQHVLLGEQHLTRETPAFAEALLPDLLANGFEVFAVETGPLSAERLVELVAGPDGAFEDELRARPRTFPFFDQAEEVALLRRAVGGGMEVWGLDQEFFFAGRLHLERLAELAPDDRARDLVAEWQERTRRDLAKALLGERDIELLLTATPEQLEALRGAFASADDPEAARILDEVTRSAEVYGLFRGGANYESNRRRIVLMKDHLRQLAARRGSSPPPKVFFKFGSMHMGRGYSPLHQLDLGNHAAELAAAAGRDSVHVVLMGLAFEPRGGERRAGAGLGGLEALTGSAVEDAWTLFDLRSLRPALHAAKDGTWPDELERLVWRYDFAVIVPVLHGATPLLAK